MFEILSMSLRYVFIVIIYLFILNIIRLIYLDIRATAESGPRTRVAYLEIINRPDNLNLMIDDIFPVQKEITIGRGMRNGVQIKEPEISKYHSRIFRDGDYYFLEDLDSSNGTYLNGELVEDEVIEIVDGDLISIGRIQFMFVDR